MDRRFRIATFNAENLAHPGMFFYKRPGDAPFSEDAFTEKSDWIASILDAGRADIVGFQEVFSLEGLQGCLAKSKYLGGSNLQVKVPACEINPATGEPSNLKKDHKGRDAVEGPNCGIASRFPILRCEGISDFPRDVRFDIPTGLHDDEGDVVNLPISKFERAVIKARIELPNGIPITVFVAHLKSKRPKFLNSESKEQQQQPVTQALGAVRSLIVRAAEAVALRALILKTIDDANDAERGEPVVLLGDLNDDTASVTTEIVAGRRPPYYLPKAQKPAIWDVAMTSAHDLVAQRSMRDVAYSHIFDGKYSILDHIHISQEFSSGFEKRVARLMNVVVFNDHVQDSNLSMPAAPEKVIIDGEKLSPPSTSSDHGVPVAEFELEVATASA
jgi:endonuclease/exonuclease/phosphatase family metal-dependent hydrolase